MVPRSRRRVLSVFSALSLGALAGCASSSSKSTDSTPTSTGTAVQHDSTETEPKQSIAMEFENRDDVAHDVAAEMTVHETATVVFEQTVTLDAGEVASPDPLANPDETRYLSVEFELDGDFAFADDFRLGPDTYVGPLTVRVDEDGEFRFSEDGFGPRP